MEAIDIDAIPLQCLVRRANDPERLDAENRARAFAVAHGEDERLAQTRIPLLTDDELRRELLRDRC
jgi:hypothetical protein